MISKETVDKVVDRLARLGGDEYFFDSIHSPDWIEPLAARGFFKDPPPPIVNDKWVQYPGWPALEYLVRMAPIEPDAVASILGGVAETENARVRDAFVRAAIEMPSPSSSKVSRKIVSWLDADLTFINFDDLFDLTVHLVDINDVDLAYELAYSLLTPRLSITGLQRDIEGRTSDWEYEQGATRFLQSVEAHHLILALDLFSDLLQKGIELGWGNFEAPPSDGSLWWRPAIEDHEQNSRLDEVLGTLTNCVRDLALRCVDEDAMALKDLVDRLSKRTWRIFLRIALHVLRIRPDDGIEAKAKLLDSDLMYDVNTHHEFWLLAREFVPSFTEHEQEEFLKALAAGLSKSKGVVERPSLMEYQRLCVVNPTGDGPIARRYEELKVQLTQEFGELNLEHPEFLTFTTMGPLNPSSPLDEFTISEMSNEDLVDYLLTWTPSGIWADPSASSLAEVLRLVVAKTPRRFAQYAEHLDVLSTTYLHAILEGWADAAKNEVQFEWTLVLELCGKLAVLSEEALPASTNIGERDVDWTSVKRSILSLLSKGLSTGEAEIPFGQAANVWPIIAGLVTDPDPSPEAELKFGGTNMDPPTLALNTTRGAAMHVVMEYALWRYRSSNDLGLVPEVKQILEERLDPIVEPSLAVRSVYGWWMPWLTLMDDAWVKANLERIFLTEPSEGVSGWIAWETYLRFSQPFENTFEVLRPLYQLATTASKLEILGVVGRQNESANFKLGEHLAIFMLRGTIAIDDPLLTEYLRNGSPEMRANLASLIGRKLSNTQGITVENLTRAKAYWTQRLVDSPLIAGRNKIELEAFGWWMAVDSFDAEWRVQILIQVLTSTGGSINLAHSVYKALGTISQTLPAQAVEAAKLMVAGTKEEWKITGAKESLRKIISEALNAGSRATKNAAQELIHQLGDRGHRAFRDLLTSNGS